MSPSIVLDPIAGRTGTIEDFVDRFTEVWTDPPAHAGTFFDFLSPDIHLVDPVSETHGRDEADRFLQGLLAMVPSIRGVVDSWAFRDDTLFIGMRFMVDHDGVTVEVPNVDVFTFVDGSAVKRVAHLDPAALLGSS